MQKVLSLQVARILSADWDPIGVEGEPRARDEYDGYVGGLVSLVKACASVEEIARHLIRIETIEMGMPGDEQRARVVAEKLKLLWRIDDTGR